MEPSRDVTVTVLGVPDADAELAADRLTQVGAFAVEERDAGGGRVELRAVLGDDHESVRTGLGALPADWSLHLERIDAAPLETWRQFAEAVRVADDLVIRPAWIDPLGDPGVIEVAIEPGSTFGLGDHPTTSLSAAAVARSVAAGDRVLDVGCGSGVLSIVALLAGAGHATAIDIAETSPSVVRDNAGRNGVSERITASTTPLEQVSGSYDLVVANILAPTLVALASDLRRVARRTLIVSGILADRHDHVLEALRPMHPVRTDVLDGWAAVELRVQP
jgi:ribosomal protein L11 methyltransferase